MATKVDFDRKDLKAPDAFFENVGRANVYLQQNRQRVIAACLAAIAIFVAIASWHRYSETRADETAAAFLRATDALDLDSLTTAKAALENVAGESGGGIYGELAKLYSADVAVREQRWDEALALYEPLSREGTTAYIRQIALLGKGFSQESAGKPAEAAATYAAASELTGPYKEQALRDQLRSARVAGNKELSAAAIEKILELFPESPDADELSAELKAGAGQG